MDTPQRYIVDGGNIVWFEDGALLGCAIPANDDPDWENFYEVSPHAFASPADYEQRLAAAKAVSNLNRPG